MAKPLPDQLPIAAEWSGVSLFLDFDGTLAPLVDRPEDARMSPETGQAITRLTDLTGGAVAVISGRALSDLDARMAPLVLPASGSHGVEIRVAEGRTTMRGASSDPLRKPATSLREYATKHALLIEEKPGAVTLHYRSEPGLEDACKALVETLTADEPSLRTLHGHMVSEIALAGIDKGSALRHFMGIPPFQGRVPIMAGDDVTDEDAIVAAQSLGGIGIKIGDAPTAAHYRAQDINVFLTWLAHTSASVGTE
ncbi:MAG: trehalose-phosphatase [Pseudomonadota bacterium]